MKDARPVYDRSFAGFRFLISLGVWWYVWEVYGFWWGVLYGLFWEAWVGFRLAQFLLGG